jgi:hypothetical protein
LDTGCIVFPEIRVSGWVIYDPLCISSPVVIGLNFLVSLILHAPKNARVSAYLTTFSSSSIFGLLHFNAYALPFQMYFQVSE